MVKNDFQKEYYRLISINRFLILKMKLCLFFVLISIASKSQKKFIIVIDELTKKSIAYVTCINKSKGIITYANDSGVIKIDIYNNDSLYFNHVGYKTKQIKFETFYDTISLQPLVNILPELNLSDKIIETHIGNYQSKEYSSLACSVGTEIATFIKNNSDKPAFISKISIPLAKRHPKDAYDGKVRVKLYKLKPNSDEPGEEIEIRNNVFNTIDLKENIIIGFNKEIIPLPQEGIFVGIEYISSDIQRKKNEKTISIHPFIKLTNAEPKPSTLYRDLLEYKWKKIDQNDKYSFMCKCVLNMMLDIQLD